MTIYLVSNRDSGNLSFSFLTFWGENVVLGMVENFAYTIELVQCHVHKTEMSANVLALTELRFSVLPKR